MLERAKFPAPQIAYELYPKKIGVNERGKQYDKNWHRRTAFLKGMELCHNPFDGELITIPAWVARDKSGVLKLFTVKPERAEPITPTGNPYWKPTSSAVKIDPELFPNVKWKSGPLEIGIMIVKKDESDSSESEGDTL